MSVFLTLVSMNLSPCNSGYYLFFSPYLYFHTSHQLFKNFLILFPFCLLFLSPSFCPFLFLPLPLSLPPCGIVKASKNLKDTWLGTEGNAAGGGSSHCCACSALSHNQNFPDSSPNQFYGTIWTLFLATGSSSFCDLLMTLGCWIPFTLPFLFVAHSKEALLVTDNLKCYLHNHSHF